MKKILAALSFIVVMMLSLTAYAADKAVLSLEKKDENESGKTTVDVRMDGGSNIEMLQFCIQYDNSKMTLVNDQAGSSISGNTAYIINDKDGKIYFLWDSLTAIEKDGSLLTLTFESKDGKKGADIGFAKDETFIVADKDYVKRASIEDTKPITVFGKEEKTNPETPPIKTDTNEGKTPGTEEPNPSNPPVNPENPTQPENPTKPTNPDVTPVEDNEKKELPKGHNNGLILDTNSAVTKPGEELDLKVEDQEDNLVWSSSNEKVATVDENGKVTTHSPGTSTITVTNEDGTKESTCVIIVDEDAENSSSEEETSEKKENTDSSEEKSNNGTTAFVILVVLALAGGGFAFWKLKKNNQDD